LGCRQVKPKRELIRLVHTPEGKVEIDPTGKKSGRGAYLCPAWDCWEAGLKGNRLEYALRCHIGQEERAELRKQAEELLQGA
jgi:hypothetical protein